jgi:23S rRNA (uridine2552-2'-O)-methyltransferase
MTGGKSRKSRSPGAARDLKQRVKTARGRKTSSTRWLARQLNDPYVAEAKRQGLRSRAAFKLIEIDDRYALLKPGALVLDLGAAPGGWSQVAAERVKSAQRRGRVIAVDINAMEPVTGVEFLQTDFLEPEALTLIRDVLGDAGADLVLSDMAAPASGHKRTDHLKIMALCEAAAEFAAEILRPGGAFLAKVLKGGAERDLLTRLKRNFAKVVHVKPKASRQDSAEAYLLATGFRGRPAQDDD